MANQKWIAVSYCFSFLFVYVCFIFYSLLTPLTEKIGLNVNLPQTEATVVVANATMGLSSFADMSPFGAIFVIMIILIVLVVLLRAVTGSMSVAI